MKLGRFLQVIDKMNINGFGLSILCVKAELLPFPAVSYCNPQNTAIRQHVGRASNGHCINLQMQH
jgi:hypothetical protein